MILIVFHGVWVYHWVAPWHHPHRLAAQLGPRALCTHEARTADGERERASDEGGIVRPRVKARLDLGVEPWGRFWWRCSAAVRLERSMNEAAPVCDRPVRRRPRGSCQLGLRCLSGRADRSLGGTSHRQPRRRSLAPRDGVAHREVVEQPRVGGAWRRSAPVQRAVGAFPRSTPPYRLRGGALREGRQGLRRRSAPSGGMAVRRRGVRGEVADGAARSRCHQVRGSERPRRRRSTWPRAVAQQVAWLSLEVCVAPHRPHKVTVQSSIFRRPLLRLERPREEAG